MTAMSNGRSLSEHANFFAEAYRKFIHLRGIIDSTPNRIVNPSEFKLSRKPEDNYLENMKLSAAEEFVAQLANRINEFCKMILGLKSWEKVIAQYEPHDQCYLENEFVGPLLQLPLYQPAGIKAQFVFSL